MEISLNKDQIRGIPVVTLAPKAAQGCPAIFFIPGFGSNKESGLSLGYQLARRGFFFISFDPRLQGERHDTRFEQAARDSVYPPESGLDTGFLLFRVIHQCLIDMRALIAHYADDPRIDIERCGVTGISMGAYASFLVFANIPQIRAAVPILGVPAFTERWLDLLDECALSNSDWADALQGLEEYTQEQTTFIMAIDPYAGLKDAAPRALLIINGEFDTEQPKQYAMACYRELQPYYAEYPGKLRLNIFPTGHVLTPDMRRDTVEWFRKHLLTDE